MLYVRGVKIDLDTLFRVIGRKRLATAVKVSPGRVTQVRAAGVMPSSWAKPVRAELAKINPEFEAPDSLFNFK